MLKKLCGFAFLATTASAMALAGPGGSKGKPDKGGGDGGTGAFVPAYMYSGGRPGGSLAFANAEVSITRAITDFRGGGVIEVNAETGRVLVNEEHAIVLFGYAIDASGNVDVLSSETLLRPSGDGGSGSVLGGACVALASTGHAAYSSTLGLFLRDPDGTQQLLEGVDVPSCAYVRGTSRLVAAMRDQDAGTVTFVEIDAGGSQSTIGTIPGGIDGLDVAGNGTQLRLLVSRYYDLKNEVVEWEAGEDIDANPVIEAGSRGHYTCDLGSDGWPKGSLYMTTRQVWIENTNTRRAIFGTKGNRQPLQAVPVC